MAELSDAIFGLAWTIPALIVGSIAFVLTWMGLASMFGILGIVLGWLPAIFVGYIAGLAWPLAILGIVKVLN